MKSVTNSFVTGKTQSGFTLIELMIVVAIATIIAAIAYPSYVQYTIRASRSAAQSFMLNVANKQEQYMLDARQYTDDLSVLDLVPPEEVSSRYTVTIGGIAATPPAYTITATAIGNQASKDTACGNLTLDQAGTKGESGTDTVAACW